MEQTTLTLSTVAMLGLFVGVAFWIVRALNTHHEGQLEKIDNMRRDVALDRESRHVDKFPPPVPRLQACAYCDRMLMRNAGRICRNCGAPNPTYEANENIRRAIAERYPPPDPEYDAARVKVRLSLETTGKLRSSFGPTLEDIAAGPVRLDS